MCMQTVLLTEEVFQHGINHGNRDKPWKQANIQEIYLLCTSQLQQSARAEHQNCVGKWVGAGDATKR